MRTWLSIRLYVSESKQLRITCCLSVERCKAPRSTLDIQALHIRQLIAHTQQVVKKWPLGRCYSMYEE